jgi:diguanylate cyclase
MSGVSQTSGRETPRRLTLFVRFAACLAAMVAVWAVFAVDPDGIGWEPFLLVAFVLVLDVAIINVRIRTTLQGVVPMSAAVLLCVAYVPPEQAILIVGLGMLLSKLVQRQVAIKAVLNTAKEIVAVAGAAAVAATLGFAPVSVDRHVPHDLLRDAAVLGAAAIIYALIDDLLTIPVIAMASGTPARALLRRNLDLRLAIRLGGFIAAFVTFLVVRDDSRFLLALPVLVYGLHLGSAITIRARTEREAWQRLAQATDEFNSVDLDGVLRTAVIRAADLFSVHEVEVEIVDPPRMVRGDSTGVSYDGPPVPPPADQAITIDLTTSDDQASLGELRLIVRGGQITLSERENFTLTTFAAALCTAVRNAGTHAATKRLAESHARAAAIDPLTGLANRRRLRDYAADILAASPPRGLTALVLIDLNHFKEINDTLGHSAGDQVLKEIAVRLDASARPDDLVARLGGDEFAILLVGLPAPALATSRAHAMLAALDPAMEIDGIRMSIEACGGVALATGDCDIEELLRRADVAMYQAKRAGQPVCVFARSRDTADVGSLALGGDLPRAIAEGEFRVNFQPIVDLGSGEIIGAEALTRWAHPDRGDLAPDRFLDSVERSGLLSGFVELVFDRALTALARWRAAGYAIAVSVNVSPRSLLDSEFPQVVEGRLAAHGVPPTSLVIELTETVTLSQLEVVDDALRQLRQLGVRLALDDFGTGYSSLATLARVPVNELKIDRSFVAALDAPTEAAVVRSTIELGRSLDLLVVAEGVESERQRTRLWELGCPLGQGHLFARPMAPDNLLAALQAGTHGRAGSLAAPLHETGAVIRIPPSRRARGGGALGQQSADG